MSVYSPTEQFTIPHDIATEAQTTSSLQTTAVSDVQGAKQYGNYSDTEYSEAGIYHSPLTTRGYSFSSSTISPSQMMSPSTFQGFNSPSFPSAESMMTASGGVYSGAMSPTAYISPYGPGKQYTWPAPNGMSYGAFGMNSHDLMQSGYTAAAAAYQPSYSQMTMTRTNYPAGYFPAQVPSSSTSPTI